MGMLDGAIDEQALTNGLIQLMNICLNRVQDEILATKRVVITIELQDKEERR